MNEENSTRVSANEIRARRAKGIKSLTDWTRIDALTDQEIASSIKDDPDWAEFLDVDWAKAQVVYPVTKSAISIRLDDDVIDFFKAGGKGYQSRMNAVLRHFMTEHKRSDKAG
jgi:uncharacterized protein (DUF4415 family)